MLETSYRTPGQLIQALLDARGWTQRVLAAILNTSETGLNKIISGKQPLDAEMAISLSTVFDVPAERFLDLQKSYELAQTRLVFREDPEIEKRARLFGTLPLNEMIKRGWLNVDSMKNFKVIESEIIRFFDASSLEDVEVFPHAAKKTNVAGDATPTQLAWLYRVKQIAREMLVAKYSLPSVTDAVERLKPLRSSPNDLRKVPRILQDAGIRYVIVEKLPGAKIDGVCFWLREDAPVIGMSLQHDRIDNFWFVLRHELEHVIQGHGRTVAMLDAELDIEDVGTDAIAEEERVANQAAGEFCVSQKALSAFIARKAPFFADRDIMGFAKTYQIHPGLVAGQLRRRLKRYDRFQAHLAKIRSSVAPGAIVDGWGDVAPVGKN